ncbi:hypothetical protein P3X46_026563 [Hevea brasiliensis]|uniref:Uncharacterized protein n=1 Tax=Hevea brasiliensis TaxID=3981 RepID=A0ABQ9KY74_HEVBR|nr:uncharacterized protein LOC110669741 isoform X2 [Hevea brasiliensis]KAJ9153079.1 hypothetical protein P3X46_026563 [Hevea brasiliensis]
MESFESNWINEDHQINNTHAANNTDHGWQKVTYTKRNRKQKPADSASAANAGKVNGTAIPNEKSNVFRSLEQQSEERRRRIIESQRAAIAAVEAPVRSKHRSDDEDEDEDDSDDAAVTKGNEKMEEKKVKQKKPKKPKVTVAEAAAKIDSADLAAFLADISASYEGQQEIQLMRFADYFGRAFSSVSSAQFPWVKFLRENTVAKMTDIPLSHISDAVYKTSVDFINQRSIEALGSFVLWSLDSILADLASQQVGSKSAKKGVQHVSSKSQVAIFVVLAMVLRRKPDALVNVLPMLRESSKYQGQDKLPVVAWMIAQVSQGDLAVGLYSWAHNLLPIVSGKSSNPQSRDIILQLVEKILSSPKACTILVSGAVRKGERLVPPFAYEILLRVTFPASSARVKATERFEAVYPILREVALAGSTGSKAMKQVSLQILSFAIKAAGESNPELSKEAAGICIWCLTQNAECYKHWDKVYEENPEASIAILKKLSEEWKEVSVKLAPLDPLRETLKNFRQKNEKALAKGEDSAHQAFFRDADKYCKLILGKLSRSHCCTKSMAFAVIALAVGAVFLSPNMEFLDWEKLVVVVNSQFSRFSS